MSELDRLVKLMARLRGPDGCPWDREQTHQSLKPYLIEETYEALDAIDSGDDDGLRDELGDVLLQIVFHAQLAREEGRFTLEEVAASTSEKLIRRHPHVFGDASANTPGQVVENWEAIKSREKREKGQGPSILAGIPRQLPALLRARRVQERAARSGFDWKHAEEVVDKVREEVGEFLEARRDADEEGIEEELGDVLFSLVNLARFLRVCPEEALRKTVGKFESRFGYIEQELERQGKCPQGASLEEMDRLWEASKKIQAEDVTTDRDS
ncbi:MAG: nucleoside triphosphate pyrophosphohydrolase [Gemmatimonadota bacterium]|nr:nucleoside triphosphate pyrophosphohydrolase [Gemmatimonadota bacterium]